MGRGLSTKNQGLEVELTGAAELIAELREIAKTNGRPERLFKAAIRRTWKRAAEPIAAHARSLAPKGKGDGPHMADKIAVSTTLSRRQRGLAGRGAAKGAVVAYIGAGPRGPAVLAEFGSGPRYTKSGAYRGVMPAQPFMRPAWEAGKSKLARELIKELSAEVKRTAERARKRQMKKAGLK